jgi:glycerate kinase
MAAASGLTLLGADRTTRNASTYGTGELIRNALDEGARQLVIGLGGSATTDGGAGALAALGVRFFAADDELEPFPGALAKITRIDLSALDPRLAHVRIEIACDVENPLLGPFGAAAVYGPQKGADASDVAFLETTLARFAEIAVRTTGRDLRTLPGAGAAGGLGWALATFANARLMPGVTIVGALRGLPAALEHATLCITGEGRIDEQTLQGKVVAGVAAFAGAARVPVIAFAGSIDIAAEAALAERGIACVPIVPGPMPLAEAMRQASQLVRAAAARFARTYQL